MQDVFHDAQGNAFFRADHVRFELEYPIDVGEIQDIVFVGDNDVVYEEGGEDSGVVHFLFTPRYFRNETYWNEVKQ